MKRFAMTGFLISSAVAAFCAAASMVLSGCVTEEAPLAQIHTSAYLVPDADSSATGDLPARRDEAAATSATTNSAPQKSSPQATSAAAVPAPAAPIVTPPVVALPPPPIAALPPPPPV